MSAGASAVTLTATMAIVLAAAAAAVAVGPRPASARLRRVLRPRSTPRVEAVVGDPPWPAGGRAAPRESAGESPRPTERARGPLGSAPARVAAVAMVAVAAAWLVGGIAAPAVGLGVGVAAWAWLGRLESASVVRARDDAMAALPLTAELLSAAVVAGSAPVVAAEAVGSAVGGRLGG
ncbi:MAG: hypothetical protein ACRDVN_14295, partial [Jiangellaceae bacterium]